jgi:hypothetical protein
MSDKNIKKVTIRLEESFLERVRIACIKEKTNMQKLVHGFLEYWVEEQEKKHS